jgi:hypothetical protein
VRNADGSHSCDRCTVALPAFGVLSGMVASGIDPADDDLHVRIFCYVNGCAAAVLAGNVNHSGDGVCTRCGRSCDRAPDVALLTTDLPPDADVARMLTFCRANGCADAVLTA